MLVQSIFMNGMTEELLVRGVHARPNSGHYSARVAIDRAPVAHYQLHACHDRLDVVHATLYFCKLSHSDCQGSL